ncbi:hypothetical protein L1O03_08520 [Corynebacterium uropygiale]|uniref:Uncharacterized protein n=1 Tax=Corynebacterium uropygiale TaxID=1775911 RepID=A0A9X1QR41_9CORY|nr:hypothetical protein [Corynebacterium uropygiale]MCF4007216.1 hypothetical protein [Corynebacterium uropygiale]
MLVILGVIVVVAAAAVTGAFWYSSRDHAADPVAKEGSASATTTVSDERIPASKERKEEKESEADLQKRCEPSVIQKTPTFARMTAIYCDGTHLRAGIPNSGTLALAVWEGNSWKEVQAAGRTETDFPCYNTDDLKAMGFPDAIVTKVTTCNEAAPAAPQKSNRYRSVVGLGESRVADVSTPPCDGRYILIHQSVLGDADQVNDELATAIMGHPDREYTYPGQCSSLRAQVDGVDVYPVYTDYGTNLQAMCAAKQREGGNGRTLNNNGDFTDPC